MLEIQERKQIAQNTQELQDIFGDCVNGQNIQNMILYPQKSKRCKITRKGGGCNEIRNVDRYFRI